MGFYTALWEAFRRIASGQLEQRLARDVTELPLDVLGVRVLLRLLGGEFRLTDLAKTLVAAVPNVSRVVRQLEDQGLITRKISAVRRGAVSLCLTPCGREIGTALWGRMSAELTAHVSDWSDAELAEGERLLRRLTMGSGPAPCNPARSRAASPPETAAVSDRSSVDSGDD